MSDILSQIGITKEELIDRIVDKALGITADQNQNGEGSWEGVPFSRVVDQKITAAIGNLVQNMTGKIQDRIDQTMMVKIEEVFTTPFQRTDRWGKIIGEPTTIRDLIYDDAKAYWTTKVDATGKVDNSGYGDRIERAVFYAKMVMTQVYDAELKTTVKKMAEDLKSMIPVTIAQEISSAVVKHLK